MSSDDNDHPVHLNSIPKSDNERKLLHGVFIRDWDDAPDDEYQSINSFSAD